MTDHEIEAEAIEHGLPERPGRRPLARVALVALACLIGLGLPLAAQTFNIVAVQGFPLGFYMAAEGAALLLALLTALHVLAAERRARKDGDELVQSAGRPGRQFPALLNGLATAGAVLSSVLILGSVGAIYGQGFDGLAAVPGVALGLLLGTVLIAPRAHQSGAVSLPGLFARRFGRGPAYWLIMALVLALATMLLAGEFAVVRLIGAPLLRVDGHGPDVATLMVAFTMLAVLIPLHGLRAGTWSQTTLYALILTTLGGLAAALALSHTGNAFAPIAYGVILPEIDRSEFALVGQKLADGSSLKRFAAPFLGLDRLSFAGTILAIAAGTACLPHLVARMLFAESPAAARRSHGLALGLVLPVLLTLPALAAFARLDVYRLIARALPVDALPGWMSALGHYPDGGLVRVCGAGAGDAGAVHAACASAGGYKGLLRLQDLAIDPFAVLPALPGIADLPALGAAAVAIAVLAAALASAHAVIAMLLTMATPQSGAAAAAAKPRGTRRAAVNGLVGIAIIAMALGAASIGPRETLTVAGWVLPLAAAALFPVLVLGLGTRFVTGAGATAGLIVGLGLSLYYLVGTHYFPAAFFDAWSGLSNASPGAVRKLASLREFARSATVSQGEIANARLIEHARVVANWWGLKPPAITLLAMPAAIAAMLAVSLVTGWRSAERTA